MPDSAYTLHVYADLHACTCSDLFLRHGREITRRDEKQSYAIWSVPELSNVFPRGSLQGELSERLFKISNATKIYVRIYGQILFIVFKK